MERKVIIKAKLLEEEVTNCLQVSIGGKRRWYSVCVGGDPKGLMIPGASSTLDLERFYEQIEKYIENSGSNEQGKFECPKQIEFSFSSNITYET